MQARGAFASCLELSRRWGTGREGGGLLAELDREARELPGGGVLGPRTDASFAAWPAPGAAEHTFAGHLRTSTSRPRPEPRPSWSFCDVPKPPSQETGAGLPDGDAHATRTVSAGLPNRPAAIHVLSPGLPSKQTGPRAAKVCSGLEDKERSLQLLERICWRHVCSQLANSGPKSIRFRFFLISSSIWTRSRQDRCCSVLFFCASSL